jgi:hypothetical protein
MGTFEVREAARDSFIDLGLSNGGVAGLVK